MKKNFHSLIFILDVVLVVVVLLVKLLWISGAGHIAVRTLLA